MVEVRHVGTYNFTVAGGCHPDTVEAWLNKMPGKIIGFLIPPWDNQRIWVISVEERDDVGQRPKNSKLMY